MRRSFDGDPLSDDGEPMVIADCDPGDVVAIGERHFVIVTALLGMRVGKRQRKAEPHTALLHDLDPDTLMPVRRNEPERGLRLWYAARVDIPVLEVIETVEHRRFMRQLVDRRQLYINMGVHSYEDVDPLRARARLLDDQEIPF